jgi:hypothetical protein
LSKRRKRPDFPGERPVAELAPTEIAEEIAWLTMTQFHPNGGLVRGRGTHIPIVEETDDDDDEVVVVPEVALALAFRDEDAQSSEALSEIQRFFVSECRCWRPQYIGDYRPSKMLEDARLAKKADFVRREKARQDSRWPRTLVEWLRQRAQYPEYDYLPTGTGINRIHPKGRAELERPIAEFIGPVKVCPAETRSEMLARRPRGRPRQDPDHVKTGAERTREWRKRMRIVSTTPPTMENNHHDDGRARTDAVGQPHARPVDRAAKAARKRTAT